MKLFKPYAYKFDCPSCGDGLAVLLVRSPDGKIKWISSHGITWPDRMITGEELGEGDPFCCWTCLSDFVVGDLDNLCAPIIGAREKKKGEGAGAASNDKQSS